jgi:asparagine synthetase B (glutamine-hydrolysing)
MCGIGGIHRRGDKPVPKLGRLADSLHLALEGRGRDASGALAMLPDGKIQVERMVAPASTFVRKRKRFNDDARSVLVHTRFATVGDPNDIANAHPVISGLTAAIHNGTIYNHQEITDAFELPRNAEVDSEVIPALVEYAGWDKADDALRLLRGGAAVALVTAKRPDELILARTQSYPLHYLVTDDLVVWASTRKAIEVAWAMTYGGKPKGRWYELPEWTMVRVNGKLEKIQLREKPRSPQRRSRKRGKGGDHPVAPTPRRATGAHTARQQLALELLDDAVREKRRILPAPPALEREPWMDDEVRDLMRWNGWSYDEAYAAVYGTDPDADDPDAWLDELADAGWLDEDEDELEWE